MTIDVRRRRVERDRLAGSIYGQRIGAELQQQRDHLRPVLLHREVQRQSVVLVAAHAAVERRGIGGHDPAHLVGQVHRDGREDVMPRAAADEQIHDGAMRVVVAPVPARRPADDLELVVVAAADDVAAGVGEPAHDVDVARGRGPVHRVGVVALLARVHVEPALQAAGPPRRAGR